MKERLITGVIGGALFVSMVLLGGWIFTLFMLIVASTAMLELLKMRNITRVSIIGLVSLLLMWGFLLPSNWLNYVIPSHFTTIEILICGIIVLLTLTVFTKNKFTFDQVGFVALSAIYVGFGFHFLIITRDIPERGMMLVFFVLFLIWATDSGAYFSGRQFGRIKLSPTISPKKTIEGAIGGVIAAVIVGTIIFLLVPIFPSYLTLLPIIIVISVFGQLGDLVQSALKRHYQVKDSGKILPGHGGILDRFDSLIFVLPILYLLQLI